MPTRVVYVGVDVACAKNKLLPVSVCEIDANTIRPLPLKSGFRKPPRSRGNRAALDCRERTRFADEALAWLRTLERTWDVVIRRIAVDSPRDYCKDPPGRREAELAMDRMGISCIGTPTRDGFRTSIREARAHLAAGGAENRLPGANQFWMLVGFALFDRLASRYEYIEVFPHAIARTVGCDGNSKLTASGFKCQLERVADATGWEANGLMKALDAMGYGSRHDKLDAFMAAWVASLPKGKRRPCGEPPHDVIWIPEV